MKKKNCRMTPEEKAKHELAVRLRKMTDEQLHETYNSSYQKGFNEGKAKQKETTILLVKNTKGIGAATFEKLKKVIEDEVID